MLPLTASSMPTVEHPHETQPGQRQLQSIPTLAQDAEWRDLRKRLATFVRTTQALAQMVDRINAVAAPTEQAVRRFSVELSSDLLDEQGTHIDALLDFGFDTLDAQIVDVRVVPADVPHPGR
jgi:hypothetical protein